MGYTIVQKIIKNHILSGEMKTGSEIGLRIDQTLTQDATGTMAYLQLEAMEIDRVKTELSVAYIDHNTLQAGFENADDHRYIQTVPEYDLADWVLGKLPKEHNDQIDARHEDIYGAVSLITAGKIDDAMQKYSK